MSHITEADTRRAIEETARDVHREAQKSGHQMTHTEALDYVRKCRQQGDRQRSERGQ